ncbi:MAG: hypothetical protein L7F78_12785 [Syntrophales bacterium LBB04]|nr:hypothetical protein [Syntrophales bacterium LBB04]
MENKELMTREEIQDFGVQIVYEEMARDGYEILGANPSLAMTPQIVARKNGQLCFVVVRTDVYPNKGKLNGDKELFYNLEHAERNNAVCYFASVGICSSDAAKTGDEKAMGIPAKGSGFCVDFDGLKVMTTIDRVVVASGNRLRSAASGSEGGRKDGVLKRIGNAILNR